MLTEERHRFILEKLNEKGSIDIHQIMKETATSESTVRRDLSVLEKQDQLKRVFGGAVLPGQLATTETKVKVEPQEDHFAQAAIQAIPDGSRLFLDGRAPAKGLLPLLGQKNVLIVTNSIFYAAELSRLNIDVFIPGGVIDRDGILSGQETTAYIRLLDFDVSVVAADGLTTRGALGVNHPDRANLAQLVAERSQEVMVFLDRKAAKQKAFMEMQGLGRAHVVTDLDEESIRTLISPTHQVTRI